MRFLFIGNSFTFYNEMPKLFAEPMSAAHGETDTDMIADAV